MNKALLAPLRPTNKPNKKARGIYSSHCPMTWRCWGCMISSPSHTRLKQMWSGTAHRQQQEKQIDYDYWSPATLVHTSCLDVCMYVFAQVPLGGCTRSSAHPLAHQWQTSYPAHKSHFFTLTHDRELLSPSKLRHWAVWPWWYGTSLLFHVISIEKHCIQKFQENFVSRSLLIINLAKLLSLMRCCSAFQRCANNEQNNVLQDAGMFRIPSKSPVG